MSYATTYMRSLELPVTDSNGIDGEVIADVDDGRLYEFEIVPQEMEEGQEIAFDPSWSDVERAVESKLYPPNSPVMLPHDY